MSTQPPVPETPESLPELSAERIDEIEDALFADIARERTLQSARRTRRGRLWIAGGAAAAVIAVAAVIAPSVGSLVGTSGGAIEESAVAPVAPADSGAGSSTDSSGADSRESAPLTVAPDSAAGDTAAGAEAADRDIITTASATVTADEVDAAARAIANSAVAHGGYVESMSVGSDGVVYPVSPSEGGIVYDTMPYPYPTDGAWITVRVPADQLQSVVDELDDVGEVTATSLSRQDVTEQTVDLEARIDAAQASVDRLTELMAQAESVADLIAAEAALSERQATLESYQQQLEMLDDLVAMSTLSVTVVPDVEPVTADPAGFGDGLTAGWNGLVATLNGIVVALGFLLPWLAVAALAALIVWGVVRLVRTRRRGRTDAATPRTSPGDADHTPGSST
jgi:Flp pilus assembly protein TadB